LDGVEEELRDAGLIAIDKMGLEEALGRLKPFRPNPDDTTIRQRVALDQDSRIFAQPLV